MKATYIMQCHNAILQYLSRYNFFFLCIGWVKDTFMRQDGVTNSYSHRAFTTGRRYISQAKPRPKGNSQTLKQPGKINLKDFSNVTDVIARMTIGEKDEHGPKMTMGHAPLATPELVDLGSEYAQVKDVVPNMYSAYDGDYMYALVQDSIGNNKSKLRHRREKGQPCKILPSYVRNLLNAKFMYNYS